MSSDPVARGCIQNEHENLQWREHNLSGQHVPVLAHPLHQ